MVEQVTKIGQRRAEALEPVSRQRLEEAAQETFGRLLAGGVIGRQVLVNCDPFTVIGVAPERFRGATVLSADFWVPLTAQSRGLGSAELLQSRAANWLIMGARLRPDVSLAQAR